MTTERGVSVKAGWHIHLYPPGPDPVPVVDPKLYPTHAEAYSELVRRLARPGRFTRSKATWVGGTVVPLCRRCGREAHGWPLERGDRCSPQGWAYCIRDPQVVRDEYPEAS